MKGVELLQNRGIGFGILAVLTRLSLQDPIGLWRFFRSTGTNDLSFNVEEIEGIHQTSSLCPASVESEFIEFWRTFVRLRDSEAPQVRIREFDGLLSIIAMGSESVEASEATFGSILSFDVDGRVGSFSPELLGFSHPALGPFAVEAAFATGANLTALAREIADGVDRCRTSCPHFVVCGGGAPANKFAEHGTFVSTETLRCRLRIMSMAEVVLEYLESHL
jgi:uncharacterized protein